MKQADLDDEPAVPVEGAYDDDGERVEGEEDEEEEEEEEEVEEELVGDEDEDGDQHVDGGGQQVPAGAEEEEEDEDGEIGCWLFREIVNGQFVLVMVDIDSRLEGYWLVRWTGHAYQPPHPGDMLCLIGRSTLWENDLIDRILSAVITLLV